MNAVIVGKLVGMMHPLPNIRGFMLEKSLVIVMNVGKSSAVVHHLSDIVKHI